jgi:hypothetical protein
MGGKSSDKSAKRAAQAQLQASQAQIAAAERMYAQDQQFQREQMEFLKPVVDQQLAAQRQQMAWGQQDRDYYTSTFRPVEQGLVADAVAFDTEGERNRLATQAGADSGRAFTQTRQMIARDLARKGVNPNSGAGLDQQRMMGIAQAAMRADAMTDTRQQAKDKGTALKYAAVGLGNPLAAQALSATAQATAAGTQAAGVHGAPYQYGLQAGQNYNQGVGLGMQGLNGAANNYASIYNTNAQQQGALWGGVGSMLGMGLGAFGAMRT